jgi:Siphovirus Gp157
MKLSPLQLGILTQQIEEIRNICGDDDVKLLADMLAGETSFEEIMNEIAKSIVELEAMQAMKKELAKSYNESAKAKELAADNFRALALKILEASGLQKHVTPHASFSMVKGRQSIVIDDNIVYDKKYYDDVLNKSRLRDDFKGGQEIDGLQYVAGEKTLMVRK